MNHCLIMTDDIRFPQIAAAQMQRQAKLYFLIHAAANQRLQEKCPFFPWVFPYQWCSHEGSKSGTSAIMNIILRSEFPLREWLRVSILMRTFWLISIHTPAQEVTANMYKFLKQIHQKPYMFHIFVQDILSLNANQWTIFKYIRKILVRMSQKFYVYLTFALKSFDK